MHAGDVENVCLEENLEMKVYSKRNSNSFFTDTANKYILLEVYLKLYDLKI